MDIKHPNMTPPPIYDYHHTMIVAVEIDRDIDLSLFSRFLHQSGIWHRINESGDVQVVWVQNEEDKERVVSLYRQFTSGEFELKAVKLNVPKTTNQLIDQFMRSPLTVSLILINVLCFPVTSGVDEGNFNGWFQMMTLLEFKVAGGHLYFADLEYTMRIGQYWRLLTPMLLHFGWIHIVFNLLWVWEIGRRIEWVNGASVLLLVILCSSLGANILQYGLAGPGLFGGMSGVVFGLLGFSLLWSFIVPDMSIGLPKGIYVFMLVFLVVGFTGAIDLLGLGSLANGAHLGGLLAGVTIGGLAGLLKKT